MINMSKELGVPENTYFRAGREKTRLYIIIDNVLYKENINNKRKKSAYNELINNKWENESVHKSFKRFAKTVELLDPNYGVLTLVTPGCYIRTRNGMYFLYLGNDILKSPACFINLSEYNEYGLYIASDTTANNLDIMEILYIKNYVRPLYSPESMQVMWSRKEAEENTKETNDDPCELCDEKDMCELRNLDFEQYFNEFLESVGADFDGDAKVETLYDITGVADNILFTFGKQKHKCYIKDNVMYHEDGRIFDTGLNYNNIRGFEFTISDNVIKVMTTALGQAIADFADTVSEVLNPPKKKEQYLYTLRKEKDSNKYLIDKYKVLNVTDISMKLEHVDGDVFIEFNKANLENFNKLYKYMNITQVIDVMADLTLNRQISLDNAFYIIDECSKNEKQ